MDVQGASKLARLAAALLLTLATSGAVAPTASAGDVQNCPLDGGASWCLGGRTHDGGGGPRPGGSTGTSRRPTTQPPCGWETVGADVVVPWLNPPSGAVINGTPPPGATVTWQAWCYHEPAGGIYGGPFRWVPVATPQSVALDLAEQIRGTVPTPAIATSPPAGVPAVVGVPVFVAVTNWRGPMVRHGTVVGIAVTVTATPTVVVDPGDGTTPHVCNGPGRLYNPSAGDLWAQATVPDACTLTYTKRSGVPGRPREWPSTVTVRWTITWSSAEGGGGSFPAADRTVALPRPVREVQTIVTTGD